MEKQSWETIFVRWIQGNGLPKYIWFIMKLEKQTRTDLGVLIRTCTTGKSLLEQKAKASAWLKELDACSSLPLIWPVSSSSQLVLFLYPWPVRCHHHLKQLHVHQLHAYWRSHRKRLWQAVQLECTRVWGTPVEEPGLPWAWFWYLKLNPWV